MPPDQPSGALGTVGAVFFGGPAAGGEVKLPEPFSLGGICSEPWASDIIQAASANCVGIPASRSWRGG